MGDLIFWAVRNRKKEKAAVATITKKNKKRKALKTAVAQVLEVHTPCSTV